MLSCPESVSSEELSELLELLDEELESELESDACPVDFSRSILLAIAANSGSTFCTRKVEIFTMNVEKIERFIFEVKFS